MSTYEFSGFVSFTLAIILLFIGKAALSRVELLRRYSIPEPVIGGFLCAAAVGVAYYFFDLQVSFTLEVRDWLLLYFFAAIGLRADIRTLISGGKPLAILLGLASSFIVLQNLLGISMATLFGLDPKAGLMVGSISLTGGVGTALAWAPTFVEQLGIANALELGVATNTVGLIAACVIGGPIARYLILRHKLAPAGDGQLDIGVGYQEELTTKVDSYGVLWAWLWLNVALIIGYALNEALQAASLQLPLFVSCLMAGILIGNTRNLLFKRDETYPGSRLGIALISDISLGMFLTMALMGLQLWELQGLVGISVGCAVPDPAVGPVHRLHRVPNHGQGLRGERHKRRLRRHHAGLDGHRDRQHVGRGEAIRPRAPGLHHRALGLRLLHRPGERPDHQLLCWPLTG